ncbi:hypothetical protein H4R18_003024 [Coemansia javaensis]|uniref:Uncharacterized protein n=1 Tax=Coemansia javaensis TaxID=2761396 RepID=A0A9W8LHY6_9FUNG|nr:hypothetical protein H4R18_003024 [Coemansia javaensis]
MADNLKPEKKGVKPELIDKTAFASMCGQELYDYLKSRLPTKGTTGISFIRKGLLLSQLDQTSIKSFAESMVALHTDSILPPEFAAEPFTPMLYMHQKPDKPEIILPPEIGTKQFSSTLYLHQRDKNGNFIVPPQERAPLLSPKSSTDTIVSPPPAPTSFGSMATIGDTDTIYGDDAMKPLETVITHAPVATRATAAARTEVNEYRCCIIM